MRFVHAYNAKQLVRALGGMVVFAGLDSEYLRASSQGSHDEPLGEQCGSWNCLGADQLGLVVVPLL